MFARQGVIDLHHALTSKDSGAHLSHIMHLTCDRSFSILRTNGHIYVLGGFYGKGHERKDSGSGILTVDTHSMTTTACAERIFSRCFGGFDE